MKPWRRGEKELRRILFSPYLLFSSSLFVVFFSFSFALPLIPFLAGSSVAAQQPEPSKKSPPANPVAAIAALKQTIEIGDVVGFANLIAGPPGVTLRKLAPALKKARDASSKVDHALADKPALGFSNPFTNELNPLHGYLFEVVEITKENNQQLARVRIGLVNQLKEETVSVTQEDNLWRVSLPGDFLKSVKRLTSERLTRQIEKLTKLTDILNKLADDISAGKLTTKEAVLLNLANAVKDAKLNESNPSAIKP
jgi:hypothetical protein